MHLPPYIYGVLLVGLTLPGIEPGTLSTGGNSNHSANGIFCHTRLNPTEHECQIFCILPTVRDYVKLVSFIELHRISNGCRRLKIICLVRC